MVTLASLYGASKILNYIYESVVMKSSNIKATKKDLLGPACGMGGGVGVVHLACYFGNLDIL